MNAIPLTPETAALAARIIWFEPPETALGDPIRFLAYAMAHATPRDLRAIRQYLSDDDFREALASAPPGIIDPRSWSYWHARLGLDPRRPRPARRLG